MTDVAKQLPLLQRNVATNSPGSDIVHVRELDWTNEEHRQGLESWKGSWTMIFGSDIGYEPQLFEALRLTLLAQCSEETVMYLALADRQEDDEPDVQDFIQAVQGRFECQVVH